MTRYKTTIKPDDEAQSKRFFETAREIGVTRNDSRTDQLMGELAKEWQPQTRKPAKPTN